MIITRISAKVTRTTNEDIIRIVSDRSNYSDPQKLYPYLSEAYNRNFLDPFIIVTNNYDIRNDKTIIDLSLKVIEKNYNTQVEKTIEIIENMLNNNMIQDKNVKRLLGIATDSDPIKTELLLLKNTPKEINNYLISANSLYNNIFPAWSNPVIDNMIERLKQGVPFENIEVAMALMTRLYMNKSDEKIAELAKYNLSPEIAEIFNNAGETFRGANRQLYDNIKSNQNYGVGLGSEELKNISPQIFLPRLAEILTSPNTHKRTLKWYVDFLMLKIQAFENWLVAAFNWDLSSSGNIINILLKDPNNIPKIINAISHRSVGPFKHTEAYEDFIHIALNSIYKDQLLNLPQEYFSGIRMTNKDRQIVENHFNPQDNEDVDISKLMSKNNGWYKTAQESWYTEEVAENTDDPEILRKIIEKGKDDIVSRYAADNPKCPSESLAEVLRRGKNDWTSCYAASNPNCPTELLIKLVKSKNNNLIDWGCGGNNVSGFAAMNPNCPSEALAEVLKKGKDDYISNSIVRSPNCPPKEKLDWYKTTGKLTKYDPKKHIMEYDSKPTQDEDLKKLEDLLNSSNNWYFKYAATKDLLKEAGWKENLATGLVAALLMIFQGSTVEAASKQNNVSENDILNAMKNPNIVTKVQEISKENKNMITLDIIVNEIIKHEGLLPKQTPFRITNPKMKEWDTIHGFKIDKTTPKPKGRENFIFLQNAEDVQKAVKKQLINYANNPQKYGLKQQPTLKEALKIFDQTGVEGKLAYLKKQMPSLDVNKPIASFL